MGIFLAILLFSLIVIIHELGHFLLAKANGIQVFEFSLGMGPTLLSKQIGETLYCIKLLPLGGSCMMGEDETEIETTTTDEDCEEVDGVEEVRQVGNFNEKSVWARMSVIVAGPVFNFLLAWIFATIMVFWIGYGSAEIGSIVTESAAEEAGLEAGDVITTMNGRNVYLWSEISTYNQFNQGETVVIEYERDGESYELTVVPELDEESGMYLLGITSSSYKAGNVFTSIQYGAYTVRYWIYTVFDSLKLMITGNVSMSDVSGPVGIVSIVDETYEASASYGWKVVLLNLMNLAVLLSANLGVMNLLPIPALDGGRLVFLIVEAIRRKRIPPEKEGMVHLAGFVLLMALMLVILFNDVMKLI